MLITHPGRGWARDKLQCGEAGRDAIDAEDHMFNSISATCDPHVVPAQATLFAVPESMYFK
jgi:hypothetical protein